MNGETAQVIPTDMDILADWQRQIDRGESW